MILRSKNPDLSKNPKTWLGASYSSGTTLTVISSVGFSNDDIIVIGEPGEEKTEAATINGNPSINQITIDSALKFSHPKDTPVYLSRVNKVSWEYKTSKTGDANVIVGMPINIQWDKNFTEYSWTLGQASYYYRFRFYNSQTGDYTSYSDWILGSGFTLNSGGYMLQNVRRITKDLDGKTASDDQIFRWFTEAQEIIQAQPIRWWFLLKEASFTTVASQFKYGITSSIGSDFLRMESLRYRYNPSSSSDVTYRLKYYPLSEFEAEIQDENRTDDDKLTIWTLYPPDSSDSLGYIGVGAPRPASSGKYLYARYWKKMSAIDSRGDTTDVPLPFILEDFAIDQIERLRGNRSYDEMMRRLYANITLLKQLNRRQMGQPMDLRWRGRRAMTRLFGKRAVTLADKENYW